MLENVSKADLLAMLAVIREQEQEAKEQENLKYATLLTDVVGEILADHTPEPSESSAWVGTAADQIKVTHDGKEYSVKLVITDVAATAERKAETGKQAKARVKR